MNERLLKGTGILQALITMDLVAVVTLLAVVWTLDHPPAGSEDPLPRHIAWGLAATFLNLVARCIAIFYMLAGGRALKDLVAEEGLDPSFVLRAKKLKRPVETLATLAIIPVMGAAMSGGSAAGSASANHGTWAWWAVAAAVICLVVDARSGIAHYRLLREADNVVGGNLPR